MPAYAVNRGLSYVGIVMVLDTILYVVGLRLFPAVPDITDWRWLVIDLMGYGLVLLVGFLCAASFGSIRAAMAAGLLYWFVWRMLLFTSGNVYYLLFGALGDERFWLALKGYGLSLLLFSPLAVVLLLIGSALGRRRYRMP